VSVLVAVDGVVVALEVDVEELEAVEELEEEVGLNEKLASEGLTPAA
jgi:hypothetical protein